MQRLVYAEMRNNYYDPTRTLIVPCPNCGARPQARVWSNVPLEQVRIYGSGSQPNMWGASPLFPLVCSRCGLVQLFTDPRNFQAETDIPVKEDTYTPAPGSDPD